MEQNINIKEVLNSLVNGTFDNDNCLICLSKLNGDYQDIFTKMSEEDNFSSTADMLEMCGVQLLSKTSKVCSKCFKLASATYLFYSLSQQSQGILNFYLDELNKQITYTDASETTQTMSIVLPHYNSRVNPDSSNLHLDKIIRKPLKNEINIKSEVVNDLVDVEDSENIVIVMDENGKSMFYKPENGQLKQLNVEYSNQNGVNDQIEKVIKRRKRKPMMYKGCSRCPVKYRFLRKLKEHMKLEHGIELHICKICKAFIEDEQEFKQHLQTHGDIHICAKCNMVFKRRIAIINHLKWHDDVKNLTKSDEAHICEMCGLVVQDDEHLQDHYEKKHVKKFTCFYCGRMYKGELSFEMHIKKHELLVNKEQKEEKPKKASKRKHTCTLCNKDFVDDRSLLWHKRLHTNERPYVCKVCGRGFVSLNRRNQHAVCAHSAPARRCPLCPALFHLRSMVNTHIKKVHLNTHKRRSRTSKYQNVYWKTETVPIQELSVSIQDEILALQAKNQNYGLVNKSNI